MKRRGAVRGRSCEEEEEDDCKQAKVEKRWSWLEEGREGGR